MVEGEERLSLTEYMREVVEWRYSEYLRVEADESLYTSDQGAVIALIRAIVRRKLPAIKEAIDRLDGRQAAMVEVVYPKFVMLYPFATEQEIGSGLPEEELKGTELETVKPEEPEQLATGSVRDTIIKMGKNPRSLVTTILAAVDEMEALREKDLGNESQYGDPKVKSVIAATLHDMARRGDLKAIFEVLDQIDGKIANRIEVKGEDVEMVSHEKIAPPNAVLNENGVYQVEMPQITSMWNIALDPDQDNSRRFGDGR